MRQDPDLRQKEVEMDDAEGQGQGRTWLLGGRKYPNLGAVACGRYPQREAVYLCESALSVGEISSPPITVLR